MSVTLMLLAAIIGAEGAAAKPAAAPAAAKPAAAPAAEKPAAAAGTGKLAPDVSKEMTESIVAINKALGLESWPSHGATPCVDRGGQGIEAKSVTAEDTRKCATTAIAKGFPLLGKAYVIAIPMVSLGPMTVIALGIGENDGWGAYSCDPERKCNPVKLSAPSKWGKRVSERKAKACSEATTLWFPENQKACESAAPAPPPTAAK
ncbi:MAG TPA: hypothetical protein VKQ32_25645 [Polyangia bacterium]|nr:hypothetical protein [Polyangia bacterium]